MTHLNFIAKMIRQATLLLIVSTISFGLSNFSTAQDELNKTATWKQPSWQDIRDEFKRLCVEQKVDEVTLAKIEMVLSDENLELTADRLESIADGIELLDPRTQGLVRSIRGQRVGSRKPDTALLNDPQFSAFVRKNLSLLVGRWYAQNDYYDEALNVLLELKTDDVADPAALLFYRALVHHRLFEKDACVKSIDRLMENRDELPRRFVQLSRMMEMDINAMKNESLDHAARIMDDINRRISLHRSGTKVIGQEKKVIDMLDKIIEELEKQQQQQQGGSTNPSSPMQDSRIAGGKGDGQAQSKSYGEGGEWGDLPPAKRAEAMAEMAKDLPPHYREVIEQYFREIAKENDK